MEGHSVDLRRHVRNYLIVFAALALMTVVTVTVAGWRLAVPVAVGVALLIASIKGSLVASFFMHLISERKLIFVVLIFTAVFFVVLLLLPVLTEQGMVHVP